MSDWSLSPLFDSLWLVVATIGLLSALALWGPNFGRLSRGRRAMLSALRLALASVLALAMLRPTCVSTVTRTERSTLLVLADRSRSMRQPHAAGSQTRWEAQQAALAACNGVLAELSTDVDVKAWTYADALEPHDVAAQALQLAPRTPDGLTDMGTSLHTALRGQLGRRLAGVVLLGDGVQTAAAPEVELYDAARELARLGYPLFTVVFGPTGTTAQARDVAVENFPDQFTVFVKNELQVRGMIRIRGYVNQQVPVELVMTDAAGASRVIGSRQVVAPEDGRQTEVVFRYVPDQVGTFKLTLRAAPQAGELVTQNNELSSYLHVLEGGLKVLYLEGELRHEQRFLTRSIDASPDMDLDFQWIDGRRRDQWPVDLSAVLQPPRFDVLVIGDLDSTALGEQNMKAIAAAVRQGRGLVMLGGYRSFGPGGYGESPLAEALPIRMDKFERQNFDEPLRKDLHQPGPIALVPARTHPLAQLAAGPENERRWQSLPPLDGVNKFAAVKEAAGVQVILESSDGAPLLVSGEYGAGRVLAFAGDSTWRWAMRGRADDHKRFWRQIILWLAQREEMQRGDVWVKLEQRRVARGTPLTWTAGARGPTGEPLPEADVVAELVSPAGARTKLRAARDKDGWRGIIDGPAVPGDYRVEVRATTQGKVVGEARGEFLVFDQDLELASAAADHDQMARLAELTAENGGRVVAPEQLPQLLRDLAAQSKQFQIEVQTRWQLGDTAFDAWLLFVSFVALWSVEWYLRKRWGLV
ncbi:MAG: glutamine amidotransferase [Pirellulales bacterium]